MRALAHAVILLWGWQRKAAAFVAGLLSALSMAPLHFAPVLFLTMPVLVWLIDGAVEPGRKGIRRLRPAAVIGWFFGFGYFLGGMWWIASACLVYPQETGWMLPFALLGMTGGLALFHGLGAALARLIWVESPLRILSLMLGMTAAELLRGHILSGLPWNLFGQAWMITDITAQGASLVGVYGLTALAILITAAPAILSDEPDRQPLARRVMITAAAAILIGLSAFGVWRLSTAAPVGEAVVEGARWRIVQPNVNQSQKWDNERREKIFNDLLTLSDTKTDPETLGALSFSHIVWPETALPFFVTEDTASLARIAAMLPPGTVLLTGAPRVEPDGNGRRYFNSIYAIDDRGTLLGSYDKVHLVPFGEYMPFQEFFRRFGLTSLFKGIGGFSAGGQRHSLNLPGGLAGGLNVGFLICYEVIFSGDVSFEGPKPDVIVNVTNDSWFGRSWGPWQHLDMTRMRAIEEGVPIVRAANSGVSAVIDAYGRVVARTELGQTALLDIRLPSEHPVASFSSIGYGFLLVLSLISLVLIALGRNRSSQ